MGDVGLSRASDREILDYARGESRVCVTLDADFHSQLAVNGAAGPSIVRNHNQIEADRSRMGRACPRVWPMVGDDLEKGSIATITGRNIRLRHLPVRRVGEH